MTLKHCARWCAAHWSSATRRRRRDRADAQIDRLRHLLKELQRARFGRRSERLDPDQLQLALEEIEQALAQAEAETEKRTAAPSAPQNRARTSANRCPHICRGSRW